jgi:hypothetical protein
MSGIEAAAKREAHHMEIVRSIDMIASEVKSLERLADRIQGDPSAAPDDSQLKMERRAPCLAEFLQHEPQNLAEILERLLNARDRITSALF